MDTVAAIKERWPLLVMCERCGLDIPPKGKFRSPFREDRNPSCEVYGERIKDWSTGESFDSIRVFSEMNRISNGEAIRRLSKELPGEKPTMRSESNGLVIPQFHYSSAEAKQLAELRALSPAGIEFAGVYLRTLGFGNCCGYPSWFLSDGNKQVCEARRMNGEKFPSFKNLPERKPHTVKGSNKSFPLGIRPPGRVKIPANFPCLLVEGGPDYLAACDILVESHQEFLPVSMLGSGMAIHEDALPFFSGRRILILAHSDENGSGEKGAVKWYHQLRKQGAKVSVYKLAGADLNDQVSQVGAKAAATFLQNAFRV
jgi:hypothetical protein